MANSLSYRAMASWCIGYPDRAREISCSAVDAAQRIGHPYSVCTALFWNILITLYRRELGIASGAIKRLSTLAAEHGFPWYSLLGELVELWHNLTLATEPNQQEIRRFHDGIAELRTLGVEQLIPFFRTKLADSLIAHRELTDAVELIETAIVETVNSGARIYELEARSTLGDALRLQESAVKAERAYREAIELAQQLKARMWELRATTGLAHLLRDQGKCTEARQLLNPIYSSFTEGFGTSDLKEAAALINDTSNSPSPALHADRSPL